MNPCLASAENTGHYPIASLPRPKQDAACCGLGRPAIAWTIQLSTAISIPVNPGRRYRDCVARLALG